jgi:UDP-N-acetyl-D-mannosaminuronic acid dehydrogenase
MKTISVVGLGYIGLPTAAIIAAQGINVIGVDLNEIVVNTINQGKIHIVEPDLGDLVHEVVRKGVLRAVTRPEPADAFLIAVPTPFKDDHEPDLSYVMSAAQSVASVLRKGNIVILESTSPVGATERMAELLSEARPDLTFPHQSGEAADVKIAYCPERVLPGKVLHELVDNDRVVGGLTPLCGALAADLYRLFVRGQCLITDSRTAEMCKLTENAFRDVNIAFANELSLVSEELGINVWELIRLANHHPRVNILQPGPGVGGHCIAVDPWFIVSSAPSTSKLIRTARQVNENKPHHIVEQIESRINEIKFYVKKPTIACLGLAFKPDIDDLRESPALEIVENIAKKELGNLHIVEPNIEVLPELLNAYTNIKLLDAKEAIRSADIVIMLVNHREFYQIDRDSLAGKEVIDTRGVWQ